MYQVILLKIIYFLLIIAVIVALSKKRRELVRFMIGFMFIGAWSFLDLIEEFIPATQISLFFTDIIARLFLLVGLIYLAVMLERFFKAP